MQTAELILLGASALVILAIAGAAVTRQAGAPLLLIFLCLGMLAGEEGPGGISFADHDLAYLFGSLALALILFNGGLGTRVRRLKSVLRPAISLATVGVIVTAAITAAGARFLFGLGWVESFLMGAIVSSTDAAAVLMLIAGRELKARPRVATTLEAESGFNDPMAVLLVSVLVDWLGRGEMPHPVYAVLAVVWSILAGAAIGWFGGRLAARIERRMGIPEGLYPIFAASVAVLLFAFAQAIEASGFLAAYLVGVGMASMPGRRAPEATSRFSDGLAWLSQIGLFLMLGLLVTPSHAVAVALPALGVAFVLIFLARPIAVLVCLLPEKFKRNERIFIAWMGLRGAVPIFLGAFPVLAGVQNANLYFSAAFAVVVASLVIQGWSAGPVSRLAGVAPALPNQGRLRNVGAVAAVAAGFTVATAGVSIGSGLIEREGPTFTAETTERLRELIGADDAARPDPVRLEALPADWLEIDAERRREIFPQIVAGLIAAENRTIMADRTALIRMAEIERQGGTLRLSQQARRDNIARRYGGEYGDIDDLLARVDIVPPSLAIAQAVVATGWGASEAARERNALYGRSPSDGGAFDSLSESTAEYVATLNTHRDFDGFRAARARLREERELVGGPALVEQVRPYAAEGPEYISQVRAILDGADDLTRFDERPAG